jgi:hypothetical protein
VVTVAIVVCAALPAIAGLIRVISLLSLAASVGFTWHGLRPFPSGER